MRVYDLNLAELSEQHPDLRMLLEETEQTGGLSPIESKAGPVTAELEGRLLHSRHDPVREARRILDQYTEEEPDYFILLGLGFGYIADQIISQYENKTVYIVLPSVSLFKSVLNFRDLRPIIACPHVHLIFTPDAEELISIITGEGNKTAGIITLRGLREQYGEYFQALEKALAAYQSKQEVNSNTLIRFGEAWVKNFIRNLGSLMKSGNISAFKDAFSGFPAVLLAAGPTIDDLRPLLRRLKERCILIAVDTTASFCAAAGIEPDFLVVVDPQYWNTRHLDRYNFEKTILISEPSTHPGVFRLCGSSVFMGGSVFPIGRYFEKYTGKRDILGAGGSVATSAWDFARYIGADRVYCGGLDLAYPQKQTHFAGSFFETRVHFLSSRWSPGETMNFSYLQNGSPFYAQSTAGPPVLTDQRLALYGRWFKRQIAGRTDTGFATYNLSERGLKIDGLEYYDPQKLLDLPARREEIDTVLRDSLHSRESLPETTQFASMCKDLNTQLKNIENLGLRGLELSEKLLQTPEKEELSATLHGLEQVDQGIKSSPIKEVVGFLLQQAAKEIAETKSAAENSKNLYQSLIRSVRYHRKIIN